MNKILTIKIGWVECLTFTDGSQLETAIRKKSVAQVKIHTLGAEGNKVALTKHHGATDTTLLFINNLLLMNSISY